MRFVGTVGIPPNMPDLTAALEELKPAHLACEYVIMYRLNQELRDYTHGELAAYSHSTIKGGDIGGQ